MYESHFIVREMNNYSSYIASQLCGYCIGVSASPKVHLPCKHSFHLDCIQRWFEKNESHSCPTCKWLGKRLYQCVRCALIVTDRNDGFSMTCGCVYHRDCFERQIHQKLLNCFRCHRVFCKELVCRILNHTKEVRYIPVVTVD